MKKKQKKINKRKTPRIASKRNYDNSLRSQKSQELQKDIVNNFVKLLIERRGGDVKLQEIAKATGVSERTIFRFFKDKKALYQSTEQYLQGYLNSTVEMLKVHDIYDFAQEVYSVFDRHENLMMAYIFSPFGAQAREIFRGNLCALLRERIIQETKISDQEANSQPIQARLAVITSLINAKIWYDVKSDSGLNGEQTGQAISWAMKLLVSNLQTTVKT